MDRAHRIAAVVERLRKQRGWSQKDLAKRAGTSKMNVNRVEGAVGLPRIDTLDLLARALDVPLCVILDEVAPEAVLTGEESDLLRWFRVLPPATKARALGIVQGLAVESGYRP